MPIYERKCCRCRQVYHKLCKVGERNDPDTCPACACPDTVPMISPVKTTFKYADRKLKL